MLNSECIISAVSFSCTALFGRQFTSLLATAFRYHSHPVNAPRPSQRDAESQHKYQALLQCTKTQLEPFVAAIVSPYDPELPNQVQCGCQTIAQYPL